MSPPAKTPSLAVLAAILVLGACGGRSSGILGVGSGSNEGGSSGSVTSMPEGSTADVQPDSSVADSPSGTTSEASSGNPVTDVDAADASDEDDAVPTPTNPFQILDSGCLVTGCSADTPFCLVIKMNGVFTSGGSCAPITSACEAAVTCDCIERAYFGCGELLCGISDAGKPTLICDEI